MGNISDKLKYLSDSVDDIQMAIGQKGIDIKDTDPLGTYGDMIRQIPVAAVVMDVEDVTDYVGIGVYEDLNIIDYGKMTATFAYTEDDLICKDVEDVTDTITIIKNSYTNL